MAAANRHRPRAPSPKQHDFDSDNTYSLVQDSMRERKLTQVARIDRMFGDSANESDHDKRPNVHRSNSKFGSVSSNSTNSSSLRGGGGSLASLYGARNGAPKDQKNGHYDAATVEQIKAQFQAQIEAMMLSQERNTGKNGPTNGAASGVGNRFSNINNNGAIKNGHIPSAAERELNGIKDIQRGKSFLEARTAVQKHIEKMLHNSNQSQCLQTASTASPIPGTPNVQHQKLDVVKHSMHGVSHAIPGELDDIEKPPPVHYGVDQAIRSGSVALKAGNLSRNRGQFLSNESLTTIIKEPSLARGQSQESVVNVRVTSPNLSPPQISPTNKKIIPLSSSSDVSNHKQSPMTTRHSTPGLKTPTSPAPPSALKAKEYVRHKVDYLGALPISASRSTNLAALQRPLKDLYFKWRALRNLGHSNLPGTLEINDNGLTVQYIRELHKGVQEIFNPFPTIAVWAAVKFVHRREVSEGGRMRHRYAFLPLISDPEGRDKSRLFHDLETETEVELAADAPHPPVFACVMRRQGSHSAHKQLECHGFVCNTSEDAIIIAANLYQALLETMKKQKSKQRPRANEVTDDDMKSVSTYDSKASIFSDPSGVPVRPPRKKKKGRGASGSATDSSIPGSILQRRRSVRSSIRSNRSNRSARMSRRQGRPMNSSGPVSYNPSGPPSFVSDHPFRRSGQRNLRRSDSRGHSDFSRRSARRSSRRKVTKTPGFMSGNTANGDVYTRVAIPRSKSFMNVNNQYNLQELFKELKEKEGVESIDDVLKKIISPNGISFNEIKPVYRELLLKLAMTMSQDELFQRSKNIMSAEKKKSASSKVTKSKKDKKNYPVSASEQSTLSSFLKLTFSSSKASAVDSKASTMNHKESKKSISKTDISGPIPIHPPPSMAKKTPKTTRKATSPLPPPPIQNPSKKASTASSSKKKPASPDDSVDDAYVSCSDCCYESVCTYDTCSCSGSGKNRPKIPPPKAYQSHSALLEASMTTTKAQVHSSPADTESGSVCDCDADSCISSEKCYCSLRKDPRQVHGGKVRPGLNGGGKLPVIPSSDSESCCTSNHFTTSEMSDSATDTTCYSVRHVPLNKHQQQHNHMSHMSLSGAETPQTAWKRNSRIISTESDTYSDAGIMLNSGSSASSSGAGSCKMCEIHHKTHHEDDHSHLSRKNSGGSGYQSNDSNCCSSHCPHVTRPSPTSCQCTSACSSCQTSLAGSLMSNRRSRPKLSLPASYNHVNLSAAGLGSPMHEKSCRSGRSASPQKILVVSAVDKSGKLMYGNGSTHSNMDSLSRHGHHQSMNSLHQNNNREEDGNNVMSMKKSAEIAAVFSGAKINQMTDIVDHNLGAGNNHDHHHHHNPDFVEVDRYRQQYSESNMHSSLGYFP